MAEYEVVHGLDWTTSEGVARRVEAGDMVDDLPEDAVEHLLAQGSINDPNAVVPEPEPELHADLADAAVEAGAVEVFDQDAAPDDAAETLLAEANSKAGE